MHSTWLASHFWGYSDYLTVLLSVFRHSEWEKGKNETANISNEMCGSPHPKTSSLAGNHPAAASATLAQRRQLGGEGNVTLNSTEMEKQCEAQTGRLQSQYGACGQKLGGSPPQAWLLLLDSFMSLRHAQGSESPLKAK